MSAPSPTSDAEAHQAPRPLSTLCRSCQILIDATQTFVGPYPDPNSSQPMRGGTSESYGVRTQTWISPTASKYPHHPSVSALAASAGDGCHLCTIVLSEWLTLQRQKAERLTPATTGKVSEIHTEEAAAVHMSISFRSDDLDGQEFRLDFQYGPLDPIPTTNTAIIKLYPDEDTESRPITENLSTHNYSEPSWLLAHKWIENCLSNHPLCPRLSESEAFLPSRLIKLGKATDNSELRLSERRDIPQGASYVTLSHCWGGLKFLTLRTESCEGLKQRIPVSELTKTFQEAIDIARKFQDSFGVEYIWIDSLCIIQDSAEDWRHESGRMGQIYANSFCNIAATGAENGQEGLILERDLLLSMPCKVRAASKESNTGHYYYCVTGTEYTRTMTDAPLHSRAWVVQERLLSPRALHFAKDQMRWECSQLLASEVFPSGQKGREGDILKMSTAGLYNNTPDTPTNPATFGAYMYTLWYRILKAYTQCEVTMEADKLVAISGIARQIQKRLGVSDDEYVAGIWKGSAIQGLLWEVQNSVRDPPGTGRRLSGYRAPSWSWASIDGVISNTTMNSFLNMEQIEGMADLLEMHATPISGSEDRMGQVRAGYIRVRGYLLRARVMSDLTGGAPQLVVRDRVVKNKPIADDGFRNRQVRVGLERLQCMPLVSWVSAGRKWIHGLLVVPAMESPRLVFARIGTFAAGGEDAELFIRSDEKHTLLFGTAVGDGRFVIDIG